MGTQNKDSFEYSTVYILDTDSISYVEADSGTDLLQDSEDETVKKNTSSESDIQGTAESYCNANEAAEKILSSRNSWNSSAVAGNNYAVVGVPESGSWVVSQDNELDYTNYFIMIIFCLAVLNGFLFGWFGLWKSEI